MHAASLETGNPAIVPCMCSMANELSWILRLQLNYTCATVTKLFDISTVVHHIIIDGQ